MYIFLFVLFVLVALLSLVEDHIDNRKRLYIILAAIPIMIAAATFKDITAVADSEAYESMFYNNDDALIEIATEPSFIYLSRIVLFFGGGIAVVFFIYALISIPIKMAIINKMTPYLFSALVIYIPVYYELHDLVQIRAAVAGAFLMLALYLYADKRYLYTTLAFIAAIMCHYSSAVFLPIFFVGNLNINKAWRIVLSCLIPIGFMLYLTHRDLMFILPESVTAGKIDLYKKSAETGTGWEEMLAPYKNMYFMIKCVLFYLYIYFYDYLKQRNSYFSLVLIVEACSLFWLLSMATIPVLASRVSDLYGIIDALFFTYIIYLIKPKIVARLCIIATGLYMYVYNMLFSGYFG